MHKHPVQGRVATLLLSSQYRKTSDSLYEPFGMFSPVKWTQDYLKISLQEDNVTGEEALLLPEPLTPMYRIFIMAAPHPIFPLYSALVFTQQT